VFLVSLFFGKFGSLARVFGKGCQIPKPLIFKAFRTLSFHIWQIWQKIKDT
jgi:hypothetical protein